MLAQGDPGRLLGLIGPDTELADAVERTGVFVVHLLADRPEHRRLAQHFAGTLSADPELLQVQGSEHGPRLQSAPDQVACRVTGRRPCGWSRLVEATIEDATWAAGAPPIRAGLLWYRGAFHRLGT
jgi:flavin reductase (DIM6/NTAB) family NADH-FMN oxidoreductase RutF